MFINVIVDISGSMEEMGKIHLQWNLCRFIRELAILDSKTYSGTIFQIFQWNSSITELEIKDNGDIATKSPHGVSDLAVLSNMLETHLDASRELKVLVLSDGHFGDSMLNAFKVWVKRHADLSIRVVAIGADANTHRLKKMSTNNDVYSPEDISAAIASMTQPLSVDNNPPTNLDQILVPGSHAGLEN